MKRALECTITTLKQVDLDPKLDIDAINEGFTKKEVEIQVRGIAMDDMTLLRGDEFVDITKVYDPETKTITSYLSKLVQYDLKDIERSVKMDYEKLL
jgi:hypothetical protein